MRYSRIFCIFSIFACLGIVVTGFCPVSAFAEEKWTGGYEAFKPADDPMYHQQHTGGIHWDSFQEQPNEDTRTGTPDLTDIYWIQGEKGWLNRIMNAKGQSRLEYLSPANLGESKYQSPCTLCGRPTYFWLDSGHIDNDTAGHIKADYPGWTKEDGICRRCFESYAVRSGKWYDGNLASSTDEYVIGYDKSARIQEYFSNVK